MAGIGPSIVLFSLYILYILIRAICMGEKEREPAKSLSRQERFSRIKSGFWGIITPIIILGGIYVGVFTPTEAGAVLVVYALFVGVLINKEIKWKELRQATTASTRMSLMILTIVAGASIYGAVIAQSQLINILIEKCQTLHITIPVFLFLVLCILVVLGMFMEAVSIMMITLPITFPIAISMGINPLWFGVFYIICSEVGLLTPPIGLNLFIMQNVTKQKQSFIIKATYPFLLLMLLAVTIIYFFPGIVTWIPSTMFDY
jgi:C4-dicarboxylate transporter DctM subunit